MKPLYTEFDLKHRGYRITEIRSNLLKMLSYGRAKSLTEMQKSTGANKSTLYRTLAMLENEGMVHKSALADRYLFCEFEDKKICHQLVICAKCGAFTEFPLYDHNHPKLKKFKIPVQNHEVLAACNSCA